MSFVMSLMAGMGSAIAQYQSMYRQQQMLSAEQQAARNEADAEARAIARRGQIVQGKVIASAGAAGVGGSS